MARPPRNTTLIDSFFELIVGQSVQIVDRSRGWTAGEIQMYGGQSGVLVDILPHKVRDKYRVQLLTGPLAGEHRYFKATEIRLSGGDE